MGKSKDLATGETRFANVAGDTFSGAVTASVGLTIADDNNLKFGDGTAYIQGSGANDRLKFIANNTEHMRVHGAGYVTMPNQPSWCLQPNHSGQSTYTAAVDNQLDMVVAGSNGTFVNGGVTTGNSGRVTVPVSGKYFCHFSFRNTNVNTWYELRLKKNGVTMHRGGLWYSSNDYENINISRVISASANDYFTANMSIGVANGIDGYGDQLTFFSGFLIG